MSLPFKLSVCGLQEVETFASRKVTHILSLLDDSDVTGPPKWFAGTYKQILISDIESQDVMIHPRAKLAGKHDVLNLIEFGRTCVQDARDREVHLLVHCLAGISRSTAAALLILADMLEEGREKEAIEHLIAIRSMAAPNRHIIQIGDALLGRKGRLLELLGSKQESLKSMRLAWSRESETWENDLPASRQEDELTDDA